MDVATSLPPELWQLILSFMSSTDIKQLSLVHSALHTSGQPFLWQTVNLCTLRKSDRVKAQAILQNPALGACVKHLRLKPANYEQLARFTSGLGWYTKNPTNVWVCNSSSIKTWADVVKRIDWDHPTRGFWHFRVSRKTVEMAIKLASHLTNIRKITFQPVFYEELHPNPHLYSQVLRNIRPNQVRCLDLDFCSGSTLQLFGKVVRELQLTFELLDTLILRITVHSDVGLPWDFKSDIQAIADMGRTSLQSLDISWSVKPTFPSINHLFDGLGFFPRLNRFNLTWYTNRYFDQITGFLFRHHTTLSQVGFGNNLSDLVTLLLTNPRKLPHLSSIILMNRNMRWPFTFTVQPTLSLYANTLTTLVLQNRLFLGLTYQDFFELVSSLDIPGHGSCLRRLKIPICSLSPEVFDVMSNYLRSLQTLDITYVWLVGHKDEDGHVNQKALFWRNMRFRQYPDWGLQCIDANLSRTTWYKQNVPLLRLLFRRIPSIREFGPVDWSDVEIK
ncbi:hypothetical protein BDN72DRAFT_963348 [Pluteus cervinus]|uniref:Uncharacterized protein n=1 Tax=Pluteus cervinus TaxID=181527 RepID=A0ACD3AHC9_9AGAR|nr:hypothetical protein BDN72DRAFT_963348 [Pluteus cervinus]